MNHTAPRLRVLIALAAVLLLAPLARAGDDTDPGLASRAPADIDLLVAATDGETIRNTAAGRLVVLALRSIPGAGGTIDAWESLADQLGMTAEDAFDTLLGREVVFLLREDDGYAVACRIDARTEKLLKKKLNAAPRDAALGLPVMTIEDGSFDFVIVRPARGYDTNSTLVIGPADERAVFDETVRMLAGKGGDTLDVRDTIPEFGVRRAAHDEPRVIVYSRNTENTAEWLGATVSFTDTSISARFVGHGDTTKDYGQIKGLSIDTFAELSRRSLVTLALDTGTGDPGLADLIEPIIGWDALDDQLADSIGGRACATVRRGAGGWPHWGIAIDTHDIRALAPRADAFLAKQFTRLAPPERRREVAQDFAGLFPEAVRTVNLGPIDNTETPGTTVRWSFATTDDHAPAGWWIISSESATLDHLRRVLVADDPDNPDDAIGVRATLQGMARPADLIDAILKVEPGLALGPLALLRQVRNVHMTVLPTKDAEIGQIDIDLVAPDDAASP